MNFDLTEDEEMLKALAERFVQGRYDVDKRRQYARAPLGFDPANWAMLGELGLIAALLPEAAGGLGLDATGIATLMEALGHGLAVEPLAENVVLAARLFAAHAPADLAAAWLPALADGSRRIALAHAEADGRAGVLRVSARVADGRISGEKPFVIAGHGADGFIVSARTSGQPDEADGVGLWFVAADAPGLTSTPWRLADGIVAAKLVLADVPALPLSGGAAAMAEAEVLASLARSAEALGIMARLFAETSDYLRTRHQFGVPLASFQALQHRMVAQYVAIEQARALMNLALVSWGQPGFAEAVRGLRAFIAPAAVDLGHEMIQLHGGMGVTDELVIGHGHKRLLVISRWPDTPEAALDAFAAAA